MALDRTTLHRVTLPVPGPWHCRWEPIALTARTLVFISRRKLDAITTQKDDPQVRKCSANIWPWLINNTQHHHRQSLVSIVLKSTTIILFLHFNQSWVKSSSKLHFSYLSLLLSAMSFSAYPFYLIDHRPPYRNLSSPMPLLANIRHYQIILNEFFLIYHILIISLNASRCIHWRFNLF